MNLCPDTRRLLLLLHNPYKTNNDNKQKEAVPYPIMDTGRLFPVTIFYTLLVHQKQSGLPTLVNPCKPVSTTLFCELAQ